MNDVKLSRVRRTAGAAAQVHQILREAVLQSRFPPGEKLIETQLAEMLGVSRTPIREALSKLEVEGLVEPSPSGGVVVRDIEAEIVEIYGLRQRIEGYAAALAAQRRSEAELDELSAVCDKAASMMGQPNWDERSQLNNRFHLLLTEASHSPRLVRLVRDYRDYFLNQQFMGLYDHETGRRQHEQHREIVEAVRRQDGALTERLVRDHFERALHVIQRGFGRRQELE